MEMKRLEIGFDSKVIRDLYSYKRVKRTKNGKQVYVSVPKTLNETKECMDDFWKKLKPNTTLRNKITHMVDFQDDFCEYEDFYVYMKWERLFGCIDSYMDQFDDLTRDKISTIYDKINPYPDLTTYL